MNANTVLYVEDSDVDVFFVRRVFEKLRAADRLCVVHTGENAVHYLEGDGVFSDRRSYPLPALVLLDLKLPGKQGLEVLEWIREQPRFQSLPVVIFTSSDLDADRGRAQRLGANDYLVKPADMSRLPGMLAPVLERYLSAGVKGEQAA